VLLLAESWRNFFKYQKERDLKGAKLVILDKASSLADALGDFLPDAKWQRCIDHWHCDAFGKCLARHARADAAILKAIYSQEDKEAAMGKAALVAEKLRGITYKQRSGKDHEGDPPADTCHRQLP
jgi:transposase-like protein